MEKALQSKLGSGAPRARMVFYPRVLVRRTTLLKPYIVSEHDPVRLLVGSEPFKPVYGDAESHQMKDDYALTSALLWSKPSMCLFKKSELDGLNNLYLVPTSEVKVSAPRISRVNTSQQSGWIERAPTKSSISKRRRMSVEKSDQERCLSIICDEC